MFLFAWFSNCTCGSFLRILLTSGRGGNSGMERASERQEEEEEEDRAWATEGEKEEMKGGRPEEERE